MNGPTCFLLALSAVAHCTVFKEVWGGTETKLKSRGMEGKGDIRGEGWYLKCYRW